MSAKRSELGEVREVPDGFGLHRIGAAVVLIRRGYEPYLSILSGTAPAEEAVTVGGGRARHPLVRLGEERALIRAYRRGGFVRHLNRRHYFGGHRAFDELLATERARSRGVSVPLVLAATERRAAIGYTASIATRWVEGVVGAVEALRGSGPERVRIAELIGEQIGRMHRAGLTHPDLNLNNILVAEDGGSVTLVDFDRARIHQGEVPGRARARNLERLGRSARRLDIAFGPEIWSALRGGYGADWPLSDRRP